MMKEAYAQSIEYGEPCEGRLSRTVLWEGEGETPLLYSTLSRRKKNFLVQWTGHCTVCPEGSRPIIMMIFVLLKSAANIAKKFL